MKALRFVLQHVFSVRTSVCGRSARKASAGNASSAARPRAAEVSGSLARRLARRLVRTPVLHLMLLAAVHHGLAGGAGLEMRWVPLARTAASQRAVAKPGRSGNGSKESVDMLHDPWRVHLYCS